MTEKNIDVPERPVPAPRTRRNDDGIYEKIGSMDDDYGQDDHPTSFDVSNRPPMPLPRTQKNENIYEEVNPLLVRNSLHKGEFIGASSRQTPLPTDTYVTVSEFQKNENVINDLNPDLSQKRKDEEYSNYSSIITSTDLMKKTDLFKRKPQEFLDTFESTHDEMRTGGDTFIIVHLLKKNECNSPILDGNLEHLALLACCSSPHVVKRALDALLNEILLCISDFSRIRCHNMLQAEKIIRESFQEFLKVDHLKAQCQRMTTYAWLITFVLLKCNKEECLKIAGGLKTFDRTLNVLLRENSERNTFRYGIHLAKESIKQVILLSGRDTQESLHRSIRKCANFLNSKLEEKEVTTLGRELSDEGSWLNLHVCLVFLQDLPKFHHYQGNLKPIILIQMLIQDYRDRCSGNRLKRAIRRANAE